MIPSTTIIDNDIGFEEVTQPSKTYKLDFNEKKVAGFVDGIEAVKQAIYKIIRTERYEHIIYSWNYGIELQGLFGKPKALVYPELKRRFTEALMQDDRITAVEDFNFSERKGNVTVSFTVKTIFGDVEAERTVNNIV